MDNMLGKLIPDEDFRKLKDLIIGMATDTGTQYALSILRHGYETTTMTGFQYQEIFKAVNALPVKEDKPWVKELGGKSKRGY